MAQTIGGPLPDTKYGLELTVEPPATITAAAPIQQGDLLKVTGTAADGSGYKVADGVAGEDLTTAGLIWALAKHYLDDPKGVLGVKIFGMGAPTVVRLKYTGAAPTVGQSVEISAANVRRVVGKAQDGKSRIMQVFTGTTEVEVLIG